jgi:hypothetical protein
MLSRETCASAVDEMSAAVSAVRIGKRALCMPGIARDIFWTPYAGMIRIRFGGTLSAANRSVAAPRSFS